LAIRTLLVGVFCCLHIFLCAGDKPVSPHHSPTPIIDSLLALLPKVAPDTNKVFIYKELCWQYRNQDMASSIGYGQKGIDLAKKLKFKKGEAEISRFMGLAYRHYFFFEESLDWYYKALKLSTQINDQVGIGFCYDNLGVTRFNQKQFDGALTFFKQGKSFFEKVNHQEGLSYSYTHLSWVMVEKKRFDEALKFANQALLIRQNNGSTKEQLSNALRDVAVAEIGLKNFAEAERVLQKAFQIAQETNKPTVIADHALYLAELFLKIQDLDRAERYATWSYQITTQFRNPLQRMKCALIIAKIYQAKKNYAAALRYQSEHYALKDSLFNEDINKNTARLEAKYQYDLKASALLEKQKRKELESSRKLDQERFLSSLLISALLFMGVIAYFIYQRRMQDRILNRELTKKNEEISRQNQEIQQQTIQLAENNRFKDRLFSIISHDLRSPVVGLVGSLELVNEGILSEEEFRKMLPDLSNNVNSIQSLLDNLLTWARIQMKGIAVAREAFHIRELIQEKIHTFEKPAQLKGITFLNNIEEDLRIQADKNMIELVLRNLISNAIKFSHSGGTIELSSSRQKGYSQICVSDNGTGMEPEIMATLFGTQSASSKGTAGEMGTGLGLLLSKEFIEKNGGKIWVESTPNVGSKFYFSVPE
jgi:two-component system, sensor histidine kinase and response regulator